MIASFAHASRSIIIITVYIAYIAYNAVITIAFLLRPHICVIVTTLYIRITILTHASVTI